MRVFWITQLALLLLAAGVRADNVDVIGGRCSFVLPKKSGYAIIVGSLAPAGKTIPISMRASETNEPGSHFWTSARIPFAKPQEETTRNTRGRIPPERFPPLERPPGEKSFHIFLGERDVADVREYGEVRAHLQTVGRRIQVYVDRDDIRRPHVAQLAGDLVRFFDEEFANWSRDRLGEAADIDRDGRFTVLLSSQLGRMKSARGTLDGFVRGSDFFREIGPPFGNRCDMLYLNADLERGPYARTILAHEFTHAVGISERYLFQPGAVGREEEGWLNEGLAHVVESLRGESWGNLDYRVAAFLAEPGKYPLVESNYFAAGSWRTPGLRGAAFLFCRWCQGECGPEFPGRMLRSPLSGVKNLEAVSGRRFEEMFRSWSVATLRDEGWRLDRTSLAGPRMDVVAGTHATSLQGTSCRFFFVDGKVTRRIELEAPAEGAMQVSLIEWPATLRVSARGQRVRVEAVGDDVELEAFRVEPWPIDRASRKQSRTWSGAELVQVFEQRKVAAGWEAATAHLDLTAGTHLATVSGRADGRVVTGYAVIER